jgi:hypothetical protein
MHILVAGREALFNVSGVLLSAEDEYNSEGCWDLEARYPECRGASKVFNNPLLKMAL